MKCAPTSAALAINDDLIRSIVVSAAAHDTGLPPKVLACAPGGQAISSARAVVTPSGSPDATPVATVVFIVRLYADPLHCVHLDGPSHPRLYLVGHQLLAVPAR